MADFRREVTSGPILLMDGAMGSQLIQAGANPGECFELWNLNHAEKVQAIHESYVNAGAKCLVTNTFQANPFRLGEFGLSDQLEAINTRAIELARKAAEDKAFILASIGPMPTEETNQINRTILSLHTADALLLETWSTGWEEVLERAVDPKINYQGIPVLLSLTYRGNENKPPSIPPDNRTATEAARIASKLSIAALGVNCGKDLGLQELVSILEGYRSETDLPLFVRPNAGTPKKSGEEWIYPIQPDIMAKWIPPLMNAGATMIGGCCGTSPNHIAAFQKQLATDESDKPK